ncbi:hypothetical protein [Tenacibaculum sp. M341]|uniref:hypothetical protein n=1 Tax=Tenacibaculum sp. M341 TaxID=2530339 RepID=UPI00104ADE64|nr:hypothetical protein [Tenacibaculum sp. M341]TCI91803.1 hypothetical protein EYW44_09630 [Tenacibaculum sp. M341]
MKRTKKDCYKIDFIESWDLVEEFYSSFSGSWSSSGKDALRLIRQMRNLKLDKEIRAGQSLTTLILSRNLNHGLDKEPHIQIHFHGGNKMSVISNFNGEDVFNSPDVSIKFEVNYTGYLYEITQKLLEKELILNEYDEEDLDSFFASL